MSHSCVNKWHVQQVWAAAEPVMSDADCADANGYCALHESM